jgi:hypothetical protein
MSGGKSRGGFRNVVKIRVDFSSPIYGDFIQMAPVSRLDLMVESRLARRKGGLPVGIVREFEGAGEVTTQQCYMESNETSAVL